MKKITDNLYKSLKQYNVMHSKYENDDTYEIFLNNISSKFDKIFSYDLDEKPACVIYKTHKTEGGFFEASRLFNYGLMFFLDKLVVYRIVESSGWDKQIDFLITLSPNDILKPSVLEYRSPYNQEEHSLHINLNLHKDAINHLQNSDADLFEKLVEDSFIREANFHLLNFVEKEFSMIELVKFISLWKENYINKLTDMSSMFHELNKLDETVINSEKVGNYIFKEDSSYLYLQSKCYDGEKSFNLLIESLDKFIDSGSKVDGLGKIISESLVELIKKIKTEEEQLEIFNNYKEFNVIQKQILENEILSLQKSIVGSSLDKLDNSSNKILILNEENKFYKSTNFITIPYQNIPIGLQFPPGHPIAKQTYVQHPILMDKFLPIEEYESTILKDKIDEFKYLVQCLGATLIEYETLENISNKVYEKNVENTNVDASIKNIGGKFDFNNDTESNAKTNNENHRKERQEFHPMGIPYVPNNLIWFAHEISWQRLAKQRLEGNVLNHSEIIKISTVDTIHKLDINQIDVEVKALVRGISVHNDSNRLKDSLSELSREIFINVQFANVLELKNTLSQDLSINKNNVYEIFNDYIKINGELEIEGLKIFRFIGTYLNLDSQEYKNYLLSIGKKQLTESEKKYIDMFKIIVSDDVINEREREMLNSLANSLSINCEAQTYLEQHLLI